MITYIEGPRNCGKTFLLTKYFDRTEFKGKIEYYKFYFANHFKTLGLEWIEDSPALHYFSLGNIMTIMEMNVEKKLQKPIVFDRAIISAYTWAILRKRLSKEKASEEFIKLISSPLFVNSKTVVIRHNTLGSSNRIKDSWDNLDNSEEWKIMSELIDLGKTHLSDKERNNELVFIDNDFNENSISNFVSVVDSFLTNSCFSDK